MLKLDKRKGAYWYARGTFLGVNIEKSLKTTDRKQAEVLLIKLQDDIFNREVRGNVPDIIDFTTAADRYIKAGGENRYVGKLIQYFKNTPINQITNQHIDVAAQTLYPKCQNSTMNRQVYCTMSAILKFNGNLTQIRRLKTSSGIIRWITPDEAECLINACSQHLRPLVMFLLLTGCRIGEALRLEWRDVDLCKSHVSFIKTKNGHARGVPLHYNLVTELSRMPHREGEVFRKPGGVPYAKVPFRASAGAQIRNGFQAACRRAGITNFRVHDCRHTWATWHFQRSRDLLTLQTLGGWSGLDMVATYAHTNTENYQNSIDSLPSLTGDSREIGNHEN